MSPGDYLAGLLLFAGSWGASAYTAAALEQRLLPRLDRVPRVLALALLFLAALIAAHLVPGAVGLLSPVAVVLAAAVGAFAASRLPRTPRARTRSPTPAPRRRQDRWSIALGALAVLVVGSFALAALSLLRLEPPTHVDALSFAMPGVANWIGTGSIWDTGAYLPLIQVRTYPNNGDVLTLAATLPWRNDAFLRAIPLPLLGMLSLGLYGVARELRAPSAVAAAIAAAAVAPKAISQAAVFELKPDVFMYATFVAGLLFLLRHARTGMRSDLVVAGLGLGLALGSRWYGLTAVFIVLTVWTAALLLARRRVRGVAGDLAVLTGVVLAGGGFWFLRNLVLTGNPLYPVDLQLLGVSVLDAPPDVITENFGFTVTDRIDQPGFVRRELLPGLGTAIGLPGLLVLAGAAAAAVPAIRRRAARPLALGVAAALAALSYSLLPGSAQGLPDAPVPGILEGTARWLIPALLLGTGATAWAAGGLSERARQAVCALALVSGAVTIAAALDVTAPRVLGFAVLLAIAAVLGVRLRVASLPRGRKRLAAVAVASLALLAMLGHFHQRTYNDTRYDDRSAVVDWVNANAPAGRTIGVAGHWSPGVFVPIYPLFGSRLENEVEYVGPVRRGQVDLYESGDDFLRALARDRYDLLVVGLLEAPDLDRPKPQRTLITPPEADWALRAGYSEVARDGSFVLLQRG